MMKRKSVRFVQAFFALSPSSPPLGFSQQNKTNQPPPPPPSSLTGVDRRAVPIAEARVVDEDDVHAVHEPVEEADLVPRVEDVELQPHARLPPLLVAGVAGRDGHDAVAAGGHGLGEGACICFGFLFFGFVGRFRFRGGGEFCPLFKSL